MATSAVLVDDVLEGLCHCAMACARQMDLEGRRSGTLDEQQAASVEKRLMCVDEEDVGELGDHLRHDRVERVDDQVGERENRLDLRNGVLVGDEDLRLWQSGSQLRQGLSQILGVGSQHLLRELEHLVLVGMCGSEVQN